MFPWMLVSCLALLPTAAGNSRSHMQHGNFLANVGLNGALEETNWLGRLGQGRDRIQLLASLGLTKETATTALDLSGVLTAILDREIPNRSYVKGFPAKTRVEQDKEQDRVVKGGNMDLSIWKKLEQAKPLFAWLLVV